MSERVPRPFDERAVLPVLLGALPDNVVKSDVVPIGMDGECLVAAVLESCDDDMLDKVRFICNREIKFVVVSEAAMEYAVQRYFS
jgi:hypothetical protein